MTDSLENVLRNAAAAHAAGNFPEAEKLYRQALNAFPRNPMLHASLGDALKAQHKFAEAVQSFAIALEIDPSDAEIMNSLGMAFHDQGLYADAEKSYRKAIAIVPDFIEAHNNLGCVLQDQGRSAEAIPHYERVLQMAPHYVGTAHNLHTALFDEQDLNPAARVLEAVLHIKPDWQRAHCYLGMIKELQGDIAAAKRHFAAVNLQGTNEEVKKAQSLLESWDYVRRARQAKTRFFGDNFATLEYAIEQMELDGLILEFGVSFGTSVRFIAGRVSGEVHGFDSFEGLPEAWQSEPAHSYSTDGTLPEVPENVRLHVGWFSDTLPSFAVTHEGPVSFMHVDCDIYSSTKTVFDHLQRHIAPGTIIVFDEYLAYPGWQHHEFRAFQEFINRFSRPYEYLAFNLISKQAVIRIQEG